MAARWPPSAPTTWPRSSSAEALRRSSAPADAVEEVVLGAANQAGEDNRDVARMAVLLAGLPDTVPGYTTNGCARRGSRRGVGGASIRAGELDLAIAGGVESMTRAPWVMAKPGTPWAKPGEVADTALGWRFTNPVSTAHNEAVEHPEDPRVRKITLPMGDTAEEIATPTSGISSPPPSIHSAASTDWS